MVGKDVDSFPIQYRTWVVNDEPDFTGALYTGLKSGDKPFEDVFALFVEDDNVVVDFNYPLTTQLTTDNWITTRKVLPESVYAGQLAIIGNYVYLFGGKGFDCILRANINDPTDWIDTGATLPSPLSGSQLAIVGNRVYLFGGEDTETLDVIYSALLSNPLVWTNHGSLLPRKLKNSQLAIINNEIYLFGGYEETSASKIIIKCNTSNPLIWTDTGSELPQYLYDSHLGIIGDNVYLFGGRVFSNTYSRGIYTAPLADPTDWSVAGLLPVQASTGQFFTIGEKGYIISATDFIYQTDKTKILSCDLDDPSSWEDTGKYIPANLSYFQFAIIDDRVFLFGGNGSSIIYTNNVLLKYDFNSLPIESYGNVTRTLYNSSPTLDLFKVLGFPNWKTTYGN